ncbi:MAG: hypothetical protein SFX19_05710 [Alphaproteobacteria bacterium]|nr:hypothetical protein [Alphaproteobacteria bacterium]
MAKILLKAQGIYGSVILMDDRVVINRPGIMNFIRYGKLAKREIPLTAISEVVYTAPTWVTVGEIEFVRAGNSRDERNEKFGANVLKFSRRRRADFEALKEKLFEMIGKR